MSKKLGFCILALWVVLVLSPAFNSPAQAETRELKFWTMEPETNPQVPGWKKFFAAVNEKTNGRVSVTPFWSASLCDPKDVLSNLKTGFVDLAWYTPSYDPGKFPITCMNDLPFLYDSIEATMVAPRRFMEEDLIPELTSQGIVRIAGAANTPMYFFFRDKKVEKVEDFKGLKIRVAGGAALPAMVEALGGTPVTIVLPDLYLSLERGLVDGFITLGPLIKAWKFYEVVHFYLNTPVDYAAGMFAMSEKTWGSLPDDIKKIILECGQTYEKESLDETKRLVAAVAKDLEGVGMTVYSLSPEELERWKKITAPVVDDYVKYLNERGLNGDRLISIAREVSEKYK